MSEPRRTHRPEPEPEAAASDEAPEGVPSAGETSDPDEVLDLFGRPYRRAEPFPVEKSGDPLGGRPIDEPVRFWWPWRRTTETDDYDAGSIPTAARDEPAPVARSLLRERLSALRRRHFPLPDEVVPTYLGSGEQVLHSDSPSFRFFLVDKAVFFLALIGAGVLLVYSLLAGWTLAAPFLLAAMLTIAVFLVFQRIADRYVHYVITNARMIRMSGVMSRSIESIPWVRVTDVGFEQSALERLLDYATLHIESANETMGLRHMRGVGDPVTFNQHLMDMVVAKQGPAAPLGRRSEYAILPEDKGLLGRRRRAEQRRRKVVLDDASPEAGTEPRPGEPGTSDDPTEQRPIAGSGPSAATPGAGGPGLDPTDPPPDAGRS